MDAPSNPGNEAAIAQPRMAWLYPAALAQPRMAWLYPAALAQPRMAWLYPGARTPTPHPANLRSAKLPTSRNGSPP